MKRLSIALALSLLASSAMAQQFFLTPAGNVTVEGKVLMCPNGASPPQFTPCSSTYPVPISPSNTSAAPLYVDTGQAGSDASSTITLGGTDQTLFSGTTPANGFGVYNPDPSEDCWLSMSTTAAANATGSIRVPANGGGYETPPNMKPFHAISFICPTTSHKFTAVKW